MVSMRPFVHLASLILLTLSFVALLPDCASACSCAAPSGSQQEIALRELSNSAAVFSGRVVEIDRPSQPLNSSIAPVKVTFRVSESWKGPGRETTEVKTPVSGVSCGYSFRPGESYLVYANEASIVEAEGLEVLLCSETKPLSKADADLEALGDGEAPDGGGALSDTSGGVSVGAMVALAGLAVTGSFLLAVRLLRVR